MISVNEEPSGPLGGSERARAQACLTGPQLIAYRRHRAGQSVSYAAAGMSVSRARFRHLVASAQRNLGYSPTYAAKQRSAYRSTGRAPGRPKKRSAPKTDEIAEMLSTWSASYRTQAAISADAAVAQEYEAWAAVVDSWRRRGLANLDELGEFLQRRQADLRRNRSRRVPYDYDEAMRVHRYDEDPVRREMREDGIEATSESHLDTDLPQF